MTTRPHVFESIFPKNQRQQASCRHRWIHYPATLYKYLQVDWRCVKCSTWGVDRGR